jgi:hypothetical protein
MVFVLKGMLIVLLGVASLVLPIAAGVLSLGAMLQYTEWGVAGWVGGGIATLFFSLELILWDRHEAKSRYVSYTP